MSLAELLILALGLAADAALVAAIIGTRDRSPQRGLFLAGATGAAQAIMPLLGAKIGAYATDVAAWTHYAAAAVFLVLAWRLATASDDAGAAEAESPALTPTRYAIIAIATSIDALVAGATFPALRFPPVPASLAIGAVTFVACALAFWLGAALTPRRGKIVRHTGAALLVAIALRGII